MDVSVKLFRPNPSKKTLYVVCGTKSVESEFCGSSVLRGAGCWAVVGVSFVILFGFDMLFSK